MITQSPSAKGFQLFVVPPEEGSWKTGINIIFGTALVVGVASKDSALGFLAVSALDYVIQESLGIEVDFDKTLGKQLQEAKEDELIPQLLGADRFDSLIEKVEPGLRQCHRPIVFSETALNAQINYAVGRKTGTLDGFFDAETYEYISETIRAEDLEDFSGVVSSFNANTFNGRLYMKELQRTVPFELDAATRSVRSRTAIVGSLFESTSRRNQFQERVTIRGFRNESVNGRLKKIYVTEVNPTEALP